MNEAVLFAVLARDEAKPLAVVEPLDGPGRTHRTTPVVGVLCWECGMQYQPTQRARNRNPHDGSPRHRGGLTTKRKRGPARNSAGPRILGTCPRARRVCRFNEV